MLLDQLSTADKEICLDKAARHLAQLTFDAQQKMVVYRGQAAIAERLHCARGSVALLISSGRLRSNRIGKKGYETTEEAILGYQRAA